MFPYVYSAPAVDSTYTESGSSSSTSSSSSTEGTPAATLTTYSLATATYADTYSDSTTLTSTATDTDTLTSTTALPSIYTTLNEQGTYTESCNYTFETTITESSETNFGNLTVKTYGTTHHIPGTQTVTETSTSTDTVTATDTSTATDTVTNTDTVTQTLTVTDTLTTSYTVLEASGIFTETCGFLYETTVYEEGSVDYFFYTIKTFATTHHVPGTATITISGTTTDTVTNTATATDTITATGTVTETATDTITLSETDTVTETATDTLTSTFTIFEGAGSIYSETCGFLYETTVYEEGSTNFFFYTAITRATTHHIPGGTHYVTTQSIEISSSSYTSASTFTSTNSTTFTDTETSTKTNTATYTDTATSTLTATDAETATYTATDTSQGGIHTITTLSQEWSSSTYAETSTQTATETSTYTDTDTSTSTFTSTQTETSTYTVTETAYGGSHYVTTISQDWSSSSYSESYTYTDSSTYATTYTDSTALPITLVTETLYSGTAASFADTTRTIWGGTTESLSYTISRVGTSGTTSGIGGQTWTFAEHISSTGYGHAAGTYPLAADIGNTVGHSHNVTVDTFTATGGTTEIATYSSYSEDGSTHSETYHSSWHSTESSIFSITNSEDLTQAYLAPGGSGNIISYEQSHVGTSDHATVTQSYSSTDGAFSTGTRATSSTAGHASSITVTTSTDFSPGGRTTTSETCTESVATGTTNSDGVDTTTSTTTTSTRLTTTSTTSSQSTYAYGASTTFSIAAAIDWWTVWLRGPGEILYMPTFTEAGTKTLPAGGYTTESYDNSACGGNTSTESSQTTSPTTTRASGRSFTYASRYEKYSISAGGVSVSADESSNYEAIQQVFDSAQSFGSNNPDVWVFGMKQFAAPNTDVTNSVTHNPGAFDVTSRNNFGADVSGSYTYGASTSETMRGKIKKIHPRSTIEVTSTASPPGLPHAFTTSRDVIKL